MTAQQIIDKARLIIGDRNKAYWSDEELARYLDDGVRELAKITGVFHRTKLITTHPDTKIYTLDDEVYKIHEVYDETSHKALVIKPYTIELDHIEDENIVLIADFAKLVFPAPGNRNVTVRYSYIPKNLGDGWVTFDLDHDNVDDQVTYDFDEDGTEDRLYWVEDGSPAGVLPDYALESLVDYVVYKAYLVDRAEQNQQKSQYHLARFRAQANRLADLAFGSYSNTAHTTYQGF